MQLPRCTIPLVVVGLLALGAMPVLAAERVALVVGNANYNEAPARLRNPVKDALAVAAALRRLGFLVIEGTDLDEDGFYHRITEFENAMNAATLAVFFYAGHGLQVDGRNYLAPTDLKLESKQDLKRGAVELTDVLEVMRSETNLIILDACRDNPLAGDLARSLGLNRAVAAGRGLARVESARGMLIAYATAPDDVASDGTGRHSPYTEALLEHLETPGLSVNDLFTHVTASVLAKTSGKQRPWTHASMSKVVRLVPGSVDPLVPKPEVPPAAPVELSRRSPESVEAALRLGRAEVRLLQLGLVTEGFDPGSVDGTFGERTRVALRQWQLALGRPPTGYLDADSARMLMTAGEGGEAEDEARREAADMANRREPENWLARHGMSSASFQRQFDTYVSQGYRLVHVSGYEVNNSARYAAIWERSSGPAWVARYGMTSASFQRQFDTYVSQGYRLVHVSGYEVNNSARYAAIWERSSGPAWVARYGMTSAAYQRYIDTHVSKGYRPVDVSVYEVNGSVRHAVILERKGGPAWVLRSGLSPAAYQRYFDTHVSKGYRPVHVSGYDVNGSARYVVIMERKSGPAWVARHGMTSQQYQDEFDDFYYQGFRPKAVSGFAVSGGQERYVALWHNPAFSSSDLAAIDQVVQRTMSAQGFPALSFALTHQGRLVFAKAYGYADSAKHEKARTRHRFRIASVSKPITSIAIMRLVDQGMLNLDDPVFGERSILGTTYGTLPYGPGIEDITVRHLLSHTGGGWANDNRDPTIGNPGMNRRQLISWTLDNIPLTAEPGSSFLYSNFGFSVLGRVIEAITGQEYSLWVKNNVLTAAGVTGVEVAGDNRSQRKPNEVVYYHHGSVAPHTMKMARKDSHGGWIARPVDLVRLVVRVDGFSTKADMLSEGSVRTMTIPWKPGARYALGWWVNDASNWWHQGGLPGTSSILVRTSGGFSWAATTNSRQNDGKKPNLDGMMWEVVNSVSVWPTHDLF